MKVSEALRIVAGLAEEFVQEHASGVPAKDTEALSIVRYILTMTYDLDVLDAEYRKEFADDDPFDDPFEEDEDDPFEEDED